MSPTTPPSLSPPVVDVSIPGAGDGARSLLILTCVDGALRDAATGSCEAAKDALDLLMARRVPVVLSSHHSVDELLAVQRELAVAVPFIAANGSVLYIPHGYFGGRPPLGSRPLGNWDVFEFSPPSVEDAVDVLLNVGGSETAAPLLVGIGATWPDRVMLRHVHVPVVVRSQLIDQGELRSRFPHAYVTNAFGPRGWSEAILGSA